MKIVLFRLRGDPEPSTHPRLGLVREDGVLHVGRAGGPGDLPSLLADLDAGLRRLADLAARRDAAPVLPLPELELAPPTLPTAKIVCVGLNYRTHAERSQLAVLPVPTLFAKFGNALLASGGHVLRPRGVEQLDVEGELAIVVGRRCRNLTRQDALAAVLGYTCADDVSARDLQFRTTQWFSGKALDTFCPLGPWLVTPDEIPDPQALTVRTYRCGRLVQEGRTADMLFSCAELLVYISSLLTLDPGDVILTGTPEGTVLDRQGQDWVRDGEEIAVEISGIGRLVHGVQGA
jgi:2-keto-4-pentenoate hydratase/2-oxohepta-3-ene-1,7-dioic acid hydratase in catechol pathway